MINNWIGFQTLVRREVERMFRAPLQALVTPLVSALLYIFIFGQVVGERIDNIAGVSYIDFVLPGVLMMNIIGSSFSQTSFGIYFQRFAKHIEEILISPLSYFEIVASLVVAGIVRGLLVGLGVLVIAVIFSAANLANFGFFLFYAIAVSIIFSLFGILIGLWAKEFEHLSILSVFVITPLSFLGGVFNSVEMLPTGFQTFVKLNPFFYFIDGIRYSMIGIQEANPIIGLAIIISLIVGLGLLVIHLFKRGYGLRV
ncbi:ABC transporter permease [Candidatus Berkelbacteria bacterium]|nr:ABC transporter permease [Candidatus Berkelbacteria bacterium]